MIVIPTQVVETLIEVSQDNVINSEETLGAIRLYLTNNGMHELFTEVRVSTLDCEGQETTIVNTNNGLLFINFNSEIPADFVSVAAASDITMQINNVYINADNVIVWNDVEITQEYIQEYALQLLEGLEPDVSNVVQSYLSPVLMGALCYLIENHHVSADEVTIQAYGILNPFFEQNFAVNGFKDLDREEVLTELQNAITKALTYGVLTTASGESISQVVDSDKGFVLIQ